MLEVLHSERFVDRSPAEVYATLLDEERYLCSVRTMYRILAANQDGAGRGCRQRAAFEADNVSDWEKATSIEEVYPRPHR